MLMLDEQSKLTEALAYLRWQDLLKRLGRSENDFLAATVFDVLHTMYSEPHRKYHHLGHIVDCWDKSEEAKISDYFYFSKHAWVEIDLALGFHDLVYDPKRTDNEMRSAQWASVLLMGMGVYFDPLDPHVVRLIMPTTHKFLPERLDAQVVVDIDLSILGASPKGFDEYREKIREEYRHISNEEFRSGSIDFFTKMLQRPFIFSTVYFKKKYEAQAIENIKRALSKLKAGA